MIVLLREQLRGITNIETFLVSRICIGKGSKMSPPIRTKVTPQDQDPMLHALPSCLLCHLKYGH